MLSSGPPPPPRHDKRPVAALVCGIIGLMTCLFPLSIVAWVLGRRAKTAISRGDTDPSGSGLATAGLVLGIIGLVISTLLIVGWTLATVLAVSNSDESASVEGAQEGSAVVLRWDELSGTTHYRVYHDDFFDSSCRTDGGRTSFCEELASRVHTTRYTHETPSQGHNYYWVVGCDESGCSPADTRNPTIVEFRDRPQSEESDAQAPSSSVESPESPTTLPVSESSELPELSTTLPARPTEILGDCSDGMLLQAGQGCHYQGISTEDVVLSVDDSGAICREGPTAVGGFTVDNFRKCDSNGFERDDAFGSDIMVRKSSGSAWTVMIADIPTVRVE